MRGAGGAIATAPGQSRGPASASARPAHQTPCGARESASDNREQPTFRDTSISVDRPLTPRWSLGTPLRLGYGKRNRKLYFSILRPRSSTRFFALFAPPEHFFGGAPRRRHP